MGTTHHDMYGERITHPMLCSTVLQAMLAHPCNNPIYAFMKYLVSQSLCSVANFGPNPEYRGRVPPLVPDFNPLTIHRHLLQYTLRLAHCDMVNTVPV